MRSNSHAYDFLFLPFLYLIISLLQPDPISKTMALLVQHCRVIGNQFGYSLSFLYSYSLSTNLTIHVRIHR